MPSIPDKTTGQKLRKSFLLLSMALPWLVLGTLSCASFLESGNAEVVLTSDSLLQGKNAEVIPDDWHKPILQQAGVNPSVGTNAWAHLPFNRFSVRTGHFLAFYLEPHLNEALTRSIGS